MRKTILHSTLHSTCSIMKNSNEKDHRIQTKILYLLNLLLFLVVLVQSFVIVYSPQNSNIQMASPDIQQRYIKPENINHDITRHRVKKREISSKTECGEKDEDVVMLNGKCSITKSDLCEYCLSAEDICKKNTTETEEKNDSEEKKKEESRDCILDNVTDYQIIPFPIYNGSERLGIAQFEEDSEGNLDIWLKEFGYPALKEYRLNENGSYEILKEIYFSHSRTDWGIVYNGSYYGRYDHERKIFKYNVQTSEFKIGDEINDVPGLDYMYFFVDKDSIWVFSLTRFRIDDSDYALQIDPESLEILSKHKIVTENCMLEYVFVAYGKVYCLSGVGGREIFLLWDMTKKEKRNVTININRKEPLNAFNLFYSFKEQYLYVLHGFSASLNYALHRYKLHFNCSSEE
ncbi:uncharacterized protein LOC111631189 [Centruroides sculpturatus]|uniref:uncharacterized protein LOC111631189 n=1 Tax=Centruroides sculpturatus TaxID=218467 RepID=UPI000C6CA273|nr:uncharacterized protein LOC111631189 [Centruroides sculpturatus]